MKEHLVDTWLVKGKKHKAVAMTTDELERASFNANILKQTGLEAEFQVTVIGDDGEKLVYVDDVQPAIWKK